MMVLSFRRAEREPSIPEFITPAQGVWIAGLKRLRRAAGMTCEDADT